MNCNFAFDPSTNSKHIVVHIIVLIHNTPSSHQQTAHFILIHRCCHLAVQQFNSCTSFRLLQQPLLTLEFFHNLLLKLGWKAKGIKETLIIKIHAMFPVIMIGPPDLLERVMLSVPSAMTVGCALRLVTGIKWLQLIWLKRVTVLFRIFWLSGKVPRNLTDTIFSSVAPRLKKQQFYLQAFFH